MWVECASTPPATTAPVYLQHHGPLLPHPALEQRPENVENYDEYMDSNLLHHTNVHNFWTFQNLLLLIKTKQQQTNPQKYNYLIIT